MIGDFERFVNELYAEQESDRLQTLVMHPDTHATLTDLQTGNRKERRAKWSKLRRKLKH